MAERVHVEDVEWTPSLDEQRSRRLLLLLFGPHETNLAEQNARPPQHAAGYLVEREGGRSEDEQE